MGEGAVQLPHKLVLNERKTLTMTGVTEVISFDEGIKYKFDGYARARVLTLSNDSHLFREGLPTKHASTALREIY